jgi:NADH:ubiquinone oxidoreductase subunit E
MNKTDILHKYPPLMENVLLLLHEFQNTNPHHSLSQNDLAMIARYLNVPNSSIYGVVSYYAMFSLSPRGKHIIKVCISPVCQMDGSKEILAELRKNLNINIGETTAEGLFTLETTECLGQCDTAPGVSINEIFYGYLTPKKIKAILQKYPNKENGAGRHKG